MRLHVLGGFLGAGKTTAMRAAARLLSDQGERVAIITNDQGHSLVDTALCEQVEDTALVVEIGGGCFCCRYDDLTAGLDAAAEAGATVVLAEAVGSCTDLVATVLAPLTERRPDVSVAPLAVFVDPHRAVEIATRTDADDLRYLYEKQVQEADLLIVTHADQAGPDIEAHLAAMGCAAPIIHASGLTSVGIGEWLVARPERLAEPLTIDYDRYAAAEALLGWANATVTIVGSVRPADMLQKFMNACTPLDVAHLKVRSVYPANAAAHLVRKGERPVLRTDALPATAETLVLTVNARVAMAPEALESALREAMAAAAGDAHVTWADFECFQPGRPVPVHRYTSRTADDTASCCAAFYRDPAVSYFMGDSWHPGGEDLTREVAQRLELQSGETVVDVACGAGASLKLLSKEFGVTGVGVDVEPGAATEGLVFHVGDAHALPLEDGSADVVLCECAVSTFDDQPLALAEMHRVLKPGGRIAVTDMLVRGPLPAGWSRYLTTGTCLLKAQSLEATQAMLEAAGFRITQSADRSETLWELQRQVKRRLVGLALARATGIVPAAVDVDPVMVKKALLEAEDLLRAGSIGYGVLIGVKDND